MKLPAARAGSPLLIKDRELDFTFHVMRRTNRRWGIHSMLYAADPWAVIGGAVGEEVTNPAEREAARSFVRQSREYFTAAERANTIETRPGVVVGAGVGFAIGYFGGNAVGTAVESFFDNTLSFWE